MLGRGENWYFVMLNVEGKRPDLAMESQSAAMAELCGTAQLSPVRMAWMAGMLAWAGKDSLSFANHHFYVSFTWTKEKIVWAGRAGCTANYWPVLRPDSWRRSGPSSKDDCNRCSADVSNNKTARHMF